MTLKEELKELYKKHVCEDESCVSTRNDFLDAIRKAIRERVPKPMKAEVMEGGVFITHDEWNICRDQMLKELE